MGRRYEVWLDYDYFPSVSEKRLKFIIKTQRSRVRRYRVLDTELPPSPAAPASKPPPDAILGPPAALPPSGDKVARPR